MSVPIALTIAGSDSGGGAGIQADLKTFSALGVFGTSALTAVTAQNTRGVTAVEDLSPAMVGAQIDAVLSDMAVGAIKVGMVSRAETARAVAQGLRRHDRRVVLDPVMVATSGDRLLRADAVAALVFELLPLSDIVTPNLPEASILSEMPLAEDERAMAVQAERILALGARAVLMKGGHGTGPESTDILFDGDTAHRFAAPRIDTANDHGTGCTLSAAITAGLAKGLSPIEAVEAAKAYLGAALAAGRTFGIGRGRGPVHHFHAWWGANR